MDVFSTNTLEYKRDVEKYNSDKLQGLDGEVPLLNTSVVKTRKHKVYLNLTDVFYRRHVFVFHLSILSLFCLLSPGSDYC